jgi:hypothetical protein
MNTHLWTKTFSESTELAHPITGYHIQPYEIGVFYNILPPVSSSYSHSTPTGF